VPSGQRADAFISIHANFGNGSNREGWKLSPPFRASSASRFLALSLEEAFLDLSEGNLQILKAMKDSSFPGYPLPSPTLPTVNMRGYFGFNFRRYRNSMSPYTPAVLIELGYLSHPKDRERLTRYPEMYAEAILAGFGRYFSTRRQMDEGFLTPLVFPWVSIGNTGGPVRLRPSPESPPCGT